MTKNHKETEECKKKKTRELNDMSEKIASAEIKL